MFSAIGFCRTMQAMRMDDERIVTYHDFQEIFFRKDANSVFRSKESQMYITTCDNGMVVSVIISLKFSILVAE